METPVSKISVVSYAVICRCGQYFGFEKMGM